MAKRGKFNLLSFIAWLTGVIVSLAVGFSLLPNGPLSGGIPYVGVITTTIAGGIVIITTIIGVVLALVDAAS